MKHLFNVLAGVGSAMNAFGTLPQYDVPKRGDSARDLALVGGDMRKVASRLEKQARRTTLSSHGSTHNRTGKK
jgi:hypothetical protein